MNLSANVVRWLTSLNMNKFKGEPRPHKPALLLAVLELAENGQLSENRIYFDPLLTEFFGEYWQAVAGKEVGKIEYPFWYMKSEPFWHLAALPGQESAVQQQGSSPVSTKWLREHVAYAWLDDAFFEATQTEEVRDQMRGILVASYFPDKKEAVARIRTFEQSVYCYTQLIRRLGEPGMTYSPTPEFVRDAAFRRVVTQAYDYTCAVSGVRLTLASGGTYQLVQAAHIHDWAASHNDDPCNGIALSPTYHWLFERGLFTLDERWCLKVSPTAPECIGTVDTLLTQYRGRRVLLPVNRTLWPGQDYLDWHRTNKYLAA